VYKGDLLYAFLKCLTYSELFVDVKPGHSYPKEKHRLMVFQNRMRKKIYGPKWDEVTGECTSRSFTICTPHQILLVSSDLEE